MKQKGFSLIEVIVVVAVIAIMAAAIAGPLMRMDLAANAAAEKRGIDTWNRQYKLITLADPQGSFAVEEDWIVVRDALSAGYPLILNGQSMLITVPPPPFIYQGDPTFVRGTGITAPPPAP